VEPEAPGARLNRVPASRACIYIAGTVDEAARVEAALARAGLDYTVEIEPYVWHVLGFVPSEHEGAAFYVLGKAAAAGREALRQARLTSGLVEAPDVRRVRYEPITPLQEAETRARRALDEARASGDEQLMLQRHLEFFRAGQKVSDCVMRHLRLGPYAP